MLFSVDIELTRKFVVSDQFDRAGGAVEAVDGGAESATEESAGGDRQLDRQLQQIRIEQ